MSASKQHAFVGFDGTFNGSCLVHTASPGPAEVQVNRSFTFRRDRGESCWLVMVERPETYGIDEHNPDRDGTGAIIVHDTQANAFLDMLAELVAFPDAFKHDVPFGKAVPDGQ